MPKLPRISVATIIKTLERMGFVRVRQSGSHVIMRRGSKGCVAPMHNEVKVGTLVDADGDACWRACCRKV